MRIVPAIFILLTAAGNLRAKCQPYPPMLAKIEVASCQSFTVESTPTLMQWEEGEPFEFQKHGETHRATLLSGEITEVWFVSERVDESLSFNAKPYLHKGMSHLELSGEATTACPSKLPATLSVVAMPLCCDVLPSLGACISPFIRVSVEISPEKWHKMGAFDPSAIVLKPKKSWWGSLWD